MNKIIVIFTSIILFLTVCFLSACDFEKQYEKLDVETLYSSITENEITRDLFDSEGNIKIEWSSKVRSEMENDNSLFEKLDVLYSPLAIAGIDCYKKSMDLVNKDWNSVSKKWDKKYYTKIYSALKEVRTDLINFASAKIDLENSVSNYNSNEALTNLQIKYYDILITKFNKLIISSLNLGEETINAVIKNNFKDFWISNNVKSASGSFVNSYLMYIKISIAKVVYTYDVKIGYIDVPLREFLFDKPLIANNFKKLSTNLNEIYQTLDNSSYTLSDELKNILTFYVNNHTEFIAYKDIFYNAVDQIKINELQSHKNNINEDVSSYIASLSKSEQTAYEIINDYISSYITNYFNAIDKIVDEV